MADLAKQEVPEASSDPETMPVGKVIKLLALFNKYRVFFPPKGALTFEWNDLDSDDMRAFSEKTKRGKYTIVTTEELLTVAKHEGLEVPELDGDDYTETYPVNLIVDVREFPNAARHFVLESQSQS